MIDRRWTLAEMRGPMRTSAMYFRDTLGWEIPNDNMSDHKFKVGQTVTYLSGSSGRAPRHVFKIMQCLPPQGGDYQYRIKSASEPPPISDTCCYCQAFPMVTRQERVEAFNHEGTPPADQLLQIL